MSWGTELWDQFDNVNGHTLKGIDFCDRYARFIKERCDIETDYASKLKKLVKNYQPKKKEEEDFSFTVTQGFLNMINELHDMAGQHEMIVENLNTNILKELSTLLTDLKQERKKVVHEHQKQTAACQAQLLQLEKAKKQYEKSFKEAEKSSEAFRKADADIHLSRAEVDKAKNLMHSRQQYSEDAKKEYALELQKTNDFQNQHYETTVPQLFQNLEDVDTKRINTVQQLITSCATIERNVIPILNTCIDGMQKAAQSIDATRDRQMVVDRYKSGFQPPGDIPFEDLSNGNVPDNNSNANTPLRALAKETLRGGGTTSGGKKGKRGGLFGIFGGSKIDDTKEDYSHLPPTQQKKKLGQKIDALKQSVQKETAERDGMLKMRDVYIQNTALGDPATLDKQLQENSDALDKLKQELMKFEGYLAACENRNQEEAGNGGANLARKMSSLSVSSGSQSQPGTPVQQHVDKRATAPEISTGGHGLSPPGGGRESSRESVGSHPAAGQLQDQDSFEDLDDDFPVIGTCRAVYTYEASNEGSIGMNEGEELEIVEADQGDGWTRVRRTNGEEGFVPSSYIQSTFYENV